MNKVKIVLIPVVLGFLFLWTTLVAQAADQLVPRLERTTTWSAEDSGYIRGLAYDGKYYYVAVTGPAGHIDIYDENGFVKRLNEASIYYPSGVATDGTKLWTADYLGGYIYEYLIETGELLRTFTSPISQPVRLDFDATTQTLWMTGYANLNVYQVDLNGVIVSSFPTSGLGVNINVALDGKGGLLVATSEANGENINLLRRYSLTGALLEDCPNFYTAYWAMATNINDRGYGFIQDTEPIFNSITGKYEVHFKHYRFTSREMVSIDIHPGSVLNSINPRSKGVIPVAILTTDTFDATTVNPLSVKFGPKGATEAHGCGHIEDVNGDGKNDLVLHFRTQDTGIKCGDTSASLTGETFSGQAIEGSDSIRTMGCK